LALDPTASFKTSTLPQILVRLGRGRLPFSKGVLVQSLMATAMDPIEAFEVARGIEQELIADRQEEIDRRELRERVATALERSGGPELTDRYRLWRRFQSPDRPVVLLLGGTSGVGKSSLSVEVARRLGIDRVLSTDSIRQIMRIMASPDLVPALYGSSYDAWRRMPANGDHPPSVIEGFRAQASAVALGIRASVDRTVSESANLLIDGVSIVPGAMGLDAFEGRAHVLTMLVAALDEDSLRERFHARAGGQRRRLADRYLENFEGILEIQRHLVALARQNDVPVIDNVDFESSVRQIIEAATTQLRAREEGDAWAQRAGLV
jgi:2-phosphoglycerate kinase